MRTLVDREVTFTEHHGPDGKPALIVELPGERKQKITTMLSPGEHAVRVEVFVCRRPDENTEGVYRYLLKRNRRLYAVAYTIDNMGDIYLVGRLPLPAVTPDEIDRLLGQVLEYARKFTRPARSRLMVELSFSLRRWRTCRPPSAARVK